MIKFKINKSKCAGCGSCLSLCPFGAIKLDDDKKYSIDLNKCQGCGKCQQVCPFNAIERVKQN